MLWKFVAVFPPGNLTFKWSNTKQFSPLLSSALFKASAVGHGPQQPSGSEPRSFSTRLQQFWGGDSPWSPSDSRYLHPVALFNQLWSLWPFALGRGAAQNPAPQHRLLHGMKKMTLCNSVPYLCCISTYYLLFSVKSYCLFLQMVRCLGAHCYRWI